MSHTPGPWKWITIGDGLTIQNADTGALVLDVWSSYADDAGIEITETDKLLILAAPDLLEACKRLMMLGQQIIGDHLDKGVMLGDNDWDIVIQGYEAIAKAEGS